jgi:hypothetical protein
MSAARQIRCIIRLGHRWETVTDTEGSVTYCARCGKTRHSGIDFDPAVDPVQHAHEAKLAENIRNLPP